MRSCGSCPACGRKTIGTLTHLELPYRNHLRFDIGGYEESERAGRLDGGRDAYCWDRLENRVVGLRECSNLRQEGRLGEMVEPAAANSGLRARVRLREQEARDIFDLSEG